MALDLVKAHAYGNDFLLTLDSSVSKGLRRAWAKLLCDRHSGVGADGIIFYAPTTAGAQMVLLNADGSDSEVSGNGLRCLAALVACGGLAGGNRVPSPELGRKMVIDTDAGPKAVRLQEVVDGRLVFEAEMGPPKDVRQERLYVAGELHEVVVLSVGNPQCVVLMQLPERSKFLKLGASLALHDMFPEGTNVELAEVLSPNQVRILIWERGVGPTLASGTGACAAAVAAATFGGAGRDLEIEAPGGTQRVVWNEDGLRLTGWAELVWSGQWLGQGP
ncbi:uncharacterized protein METZ01_LOCUS82890 [marine metagenome]|uniref:Diaminopimelate epimerase n=1 Tax=marine metagenome TaxID=408172 RepID=A0A381UPG2_9ZZZZ|tara:strand:- start:14 stop:841 length:828 start_codon:yes stop_codon:yes gene_type:complete